MKKLLFLLLGLAVTASASAGVDFKQLPKVQPNQIHKTQPRQIKATNKNVVNLSVPRLQPTKSTAQMWNAFSQDNKLQGAAKKRIVNNEPQFKVPIYDQPEGEEKVYTRSGTAFWYESGYKTGNQSGTVTVVFAPDGQTVYFKNLLFTSGDQYGDTWMYGTIEGNEIHVPLGQSIFYSSSYDADIISVWGTTYVSDGSLEFTPDESVTEAIYLMDGNTISLQNTVPGTGTYAAYEGTGLSAHWSDDQTWDYIMEWNTVFTLREDVEAPTIYTDDDVIPMAMEGGYLLPYNRTGEAIITYEEELYTDIQQGETYIYITEDFSAVYMRDPIYDLDGMGVWVKGTFDGEKIHIPLGQYIYWDEENAAGVMLGWGSFVNGSGFTADATVTEATYSFDLDNLTVILDNTSAVGTVAGGDLSEATGLALVNTAGGFAGWLNWNTAYYILPNDPENLTVDPGTTTADVAWEDEFDTHWNLRYRPFVDARKYYWDFEEDTQDNADTSLPGGWTSIDNDGDGLGWYHLTGENFNNHGGIGHVTSASYQGAALTPDNWLVSPQVNLCGEVNFWAAGQDADWSGEVFAVYVSTGDPTDVSSFVKISEDETTTGEMTQYTYDLSAYDGQRGYVAIRHYNISDMFRLNIDDITIGDPEAELVEIPDWIYVNDLTETEYTIEGLTPGTEYEVQVQSFNEGGASNWTAPVNFVTLDVIKNVYMLGGDDQGWNPTTGTLFTYDEENNVYTLNYTFPAENNYFGFTTELAENNDQGGWDYIEQFRFGAIAENDYEYTGNEEYISLTWDDYKAIKIPAGEYNMTLDLENMKLYIEKVGGEPEVLRGDVNRDGAVTIGDVTALIDHLLSSDLEEGEFFSPDNADTNLDETISISDVTTLIDYLLSGAWPED